MSFTYVVKKPPTSPTYLKRQTWRSHCILVTLSKSS
jgi:hypothetical protein